MFNSMDWSPIAPLAHVFGVVFSYIYANLLSPKVLFGWFTLKSSITSNGEANIPRYGLV